ncbi:MAG: hypothetical protein QW390_00135 [Candidatus Bathyarchaeia archaeon]
MIPSKIFQLKKDIALEVAAEKLKAYRLEEPAHEGVDLRLATEIVDLRLNKDSLRGVFSRDYITSAYFRGGAREIPLTQESPFILQRHGQRTFLIILDKKDRANRVANLMSEIIFIRPGGIVEARIMPETLRALHESSPDATKVIFFDDVDIPNVKKLSLYGSALASTSLYSNYLEHGKVWYVVFGFKKHNAVMGVTRNCVVTMFSKVGQEEFVRCIIEDILPLIG